LSVNKDKQLFFVYKLRSLVVVGGCFSAPQPADDHKNFKGHLELNRIKSNCLRISAGNVKFNFASSSQPKKYEKSFKNPVIK